MQRNRHRKGYFFERMSPEERHRRLARRIEQGSRLKRHPAKGATEFAGRPRGAIRPVVARLRAKGGDVILIRMPLHERHGEARACPKHLYWDTITPTTGAVAIHPLGYVELSGFKTADGSHLDADDVPAFTDALATVLQSLVSADQGAGHER